MAAFLSIAGGVQGAGAESAGAEVPAQGFEPWTIGLKGRCSNQAELRRRLFNSPHSGQVVGLAHPRILADDVASDIPNPPPQSSPPPPPEGASRADWHAWRHQVRDYQRAQWRQGGWYGPGWFWLGRGWFWPLMLVIAGVFFLLNNLGLLAWIRGDIFWPAVLILLGVFLLFRRAPWWR